MLTIKVRSYNMEFQDIANFLEANHRGVISTKRPDGAVHSSIVVCGAYKGTAAFVSVYPKSQKIKNLRRDANCTVLAVTEDWRSYVTVEGTATLLDYVNTNPDVMRTMLREVYMSCSSTPHPNWDEFDDAMVKQKAVIVLVEPHKIYGLLR